MLKRLRELLADHRKDAAGVMFVVILLAALFYVIGGADGESVRGCARAYAHAVNAADSARVDAQPVPGTIRVGETCGRRRARGQIPRDTTR
jgi:hypothetical protein